LADRWALGLTGGPWGLTGGLAALNCTILICLCRCSSSSRSNVHQGIGSKIRIY